MGINSSAVFAIGAAIGVLAAASSLPAATIGTWQEDYAYFGTAESGTGGANPSVTGSGSSASWDRGAGNNAIIAPFTPVTLNVGDSITLGGTMTYGATTSFTDLGNIQFRFGLFNTNSTSGTSAGWTGYMAEVPNGTAGAIQADYASKNGNWGSSSGGSALTTTSSGTGNKPGSASGPDNFALTITETAIGTQAITASFISADGTTYVWNGAATDTTNASANATYNELGFFDGGTGMGTTPVVNFSNVAVTSGAAPEPASLGIAGLGALALFLRRRGKDVR